MDPYFAKYDVQITTYNADGGPIGRPDQPHDEFYRLLHQYDRKKYQTPYVDIYFLNELNRNVFKRYLCFVTLNADSVVLGHIVLDVKLKKTIQGNVYPELLVDRKSTTTVPGKTFSYAIFSGRELVYNFGQYNYDADFDRSLFADSSFFQKGAYQHGDHHLGIHGGGDKTVVVTGALFPISNVISEFSFLFFILIFYILLMIVAFFSYLRIRGTQLLLATKIQLFLNAAFFLPLATASALILSVMSTSYRNDLNNTFLKQTEETAGHIGLELQQYLQGSLDLANLTEQLNSLARHRGQDVNIFGTDGQLIVSSQPAIYERELLSRRINPQAWSEIVESRQQATLESEAVGKLVFKTAYVRIKSFDTGKLLAILSIPYFESSNDLNHQITDVVFSLLRIFSAIFILFLALAYYPFGQD
jgi:hypothetical protein